MERNTRLLVVSQKIFVGIKFFCMDFTVRCILQKEKFFVETKNKLLLKSTVGNDEFSIKYKLLPFSAAILVFLSMNIF